MKRRLEDLAVFGGSPAFAEALHVGRPNIADRERLLARINEVLDRRWLTNNGPLVQEFEARVAEREGVRHCIAMCNGTVGLEIAIRAAGLSGEVIVPSLTFVATAHALEWQQITPVFCDVDPKTYTLDPRQVEARITPKTTGIIGVHLWGRPCDVEALARVAAEHRLRLLYDAAHVFDTTCLGRAIGGYGDAAVFSFHATKFFNTFEGGAVVTNDDELARTMRLMKNFGFAGYDNVIHVGTNGKMSELSAATGLTGLETLQEVVTVNRENFHAYQDALAGIPGITLLDYDERERCNFQYVVLDVDPRAASITRDDLVTVFWAENVLARRYFYPGCHRMEPYRTRFPDAGRHLPATERLVERTLTLPTGTALDTAGVRRVTDLMAFAVRHGRAITERLRVTPPPA
ncbi:MAG: dTDP-4-dehydro-6-deoxyglucose aminotransferase [Candidatus Rokubacteria bacterium 13_1_20CM_2_68_19]|nr:MAG: dTDP-4-dehydro-6-deoxyglucose aminotransferase [Candidatus Rokubacteria bacterium 13_2_20CM_69_10]OLB37867.1 MAG: dTDP-4-dehydro-6-deoxyglucose aminotransferase [Candidatus Rokubacteria bacterium 13_2_20CM_2_64_8]OLC59647.1 MAG: dTDP-4-dehydro-6-deoxyglucose aminotransferase [Candidatus Rokubacteria bacterium 13_1_40CM_4_67_11]OLE44851.1 MAG: dTDP-4-dehydro-6-deoxyglucose aminotransferase [Candidatus Rokubacteria bacterium 13_1_20CM_2_68_19]PYN61162.1 MAG: dTDP-4-dehydro-6-deoxyglucose 